MSSPAHHRRTRVGVRSLRERAIQTLWVAAADGLQLDDASGAVVLPPVLAGAWGRKR